MYNTSTELPTRAYAPPNESTKSAQQNAMLSPRFYTTDFKAMDSLKIAPESRQMWDDILAEFRRDPNKDHFKRNADFDADFSAMDPELRTQFIDFLVSSVTAEFSGCILYAEVKKRIKNPDVRELFGFMSRDEGRHAGFINHTLNDFDVAVDLSFLTKAKKYTFFQPKFIYYATYLSEKIGYARYITIYRNFEQKPDKRFHPIFKWFENWCLDEFRHGEAFAVLMRSNPEFLEGRNRLWIRFFLLAVFCTMYVRDHARSAFFVNMGLDVEEFDRKVIKLTNLISRQVFPHTIDTESEAFWSLLNRMWRNTDAMRKAEEQGGVFSAVKVALLKAANALTFVQLFLRPPHKQALPADVRMQPVW
jgi:magnesium-protoporphyrin IX monomethyl ester (oxidative) cyclase